MGLNEEGPSPPSLHPLTVRPDGTDGGNPWGWGEICVLFPSRPTWSLTPRSVCPHLYSSADNNADLG